MKQMYKKIEQFLLSGKGQAACALTALVGMLTGLIDAAAAGSIVGVALMAKAIESQGITIQYTVGSPTEFAGLANVTGFQGPGGSAAVIDVTNLSSSAKEKMMGLPDEGQFTIDINLDPDDAGHQALRNARANRTRCEFKINFTDPTPASARFFGYVLGFQITGRVDDVVKLSVTIEIDGAVTWA